MDCIYITDQAGFLAAQVGVFDYWAPLVAMEIGMGRDSHSLATYLFAQLVVSCGRIPMTDGPMFWQVVQLLKTSFLLL